MLSMLGQVAFQAVHALGDVFQRIGVGEAEIAFRVGAEVDTGCNAHPRVLENVKCQAVGIIGNMPRIGKNIERSGGFHGDAKYEFHLL